MGADEEAGEELLRRLMSRRLLDVDPRTHRRGDLEHSPPVRHGGAAELVREPAADRARERADARTHPRVARNRALHGRVHAAVRKVAEDVLDELRERRGVANEGPERHDVEVRLPPGVLILEDLRLLDELSLHLLRAAEVQEHEREEAAEA